MSDNLPEAPQGEFILFRSEDGQTRVECRFESDTLWLSQSSIAELYGKDVRTINEHLVNIFSEGGTCSKRNHPEIPDSSIRGKSSGFQRDRPL
ncbi:Virulence protein [Proteus mirabilis]|uniref:Virulence protein n=1 Tax=Proteus mirabilis TaxID=584 RepID=A0A2X2DZ87_PROMI|nr:Virulence protein [Proteus mirabilis]